jgi:3,4-dihydroxy 2-butanone 4-phosphate synthase/GTP cyclohydrolase II
MEGDVEVTMAAAALASGGLAIVVDVAAGSADLVMAAGRVSTAGIAFMATHARGLTELSLSAERVAALQLPPMVPHRETPRKPFTVSIEARRGVGTGISAADRAQTIRVAVAEESGPEDLISPGHVFPLRAGPGFARAEAALALARLAGAGEGAVLCTILDEAGELARDRYLIGLSARYDLPQVRTSSIARWTGWSLPSVPARAEELRTWR